ELLAGRFQLEPCPPARGAPAVPRLVRHDPQQPGPQRPRRTEAAKRAPGLDQSILRDVLGVGGTSGDEGRESDGGLPVRPDELLERATVTVTRAAHELRLGRWPALHPRPTPPTRGRFPSSLRAGGLLAECLRSPVPHRARHLRRVVALLEQLLLQLAFLRQP